MKHGREVSFHEREAASKIINKMRDYYKRRMVAEMLGILPSYVSFAAKMTKRDEEHYICPSHVIQKILEFPINIVFDK